MASSSGGDITAKTTTAALSSNSRSTKRSEADAELPSRTAPPKRHLTDSTSSLANNPIDIGAIIIVHTKENQVYQAPLDYFSDRDVLYGLRPRHYSYDRFRSWLLESGGIPIDEAVSTIVHGASEEKVAMDLAPIGDFYATLVKLCTGTVWPFADDKWGNVFILERMSASDLNAILRARQLHELANAPADDPVPLGPLTIEPPPPATKEKEATPPEPEAEKPEPEVIELDKSDSEPELLPDDPDATPDKTVPPAEPQVLTAPEFFDLIREATSPNDPRLTAAEQDELEADHRLFKIDATKFKKALVFFNTTLGGENKCPLPALDRFAFFWQVYTAYEMFMAPITKGMNGFCIGLDVGFGKTILALFYIHARAVIVDLWAEVQAEWKTGKADRHLPKGNRDATKCCPSQGDKVVQCPCVYRSDTRAICVSGYLEDVPALIVIPPHLKDVWRKEIKEFFKDFGTDQQYLRFYYYFSDKTAGNDLSINAKAQDRAKRVRRTRGMVEVDILEEEAVETIQKGRGRARDVFLVSEKVMKQLSKLYQEGKTTLLAAGVIFMDEFHRYKGSTDDTIPFEVMGKIAEKAGFPVTLFPLCGTTVEEGPSTWRAPAEHYLGQWQMWGKPAAPGEPSLGDRPLKAINFDPEKILKQTDFIRKVHKDLVKRLAEGALMEDEFKKTTDKIRPYLSILVFALRKSQVWRREILNQLPPCIENDIAIDTELDTETTSARQHYISHVQTLIKKELKRCTKEWKKDKEFAESKGEPFHQPEPTYFDIAQRAAGGHDKNAGYLDLTRMSTFPYIAVLQKSGTITRAELGSTECQKIAVDVQKLIEGNKEISHSSLLKEFADWDFHKCRHQLFDNSPKFQLLLQLIEDLLKDSDSRTAPEDKSGKRHAIVFATHNITAILIYYLLVTNAELCKDIEPILLTSSMPMPKRRQWVNYMGQPCTPESRCKILIAVTEIAAEGFNLQRVNNVWFIELPNTLTKLHQAIGRAHRTKQKSRVKIVKMYDKLNLLDKYAFNAMKSKRELADRLYNVKVVWSE